MPTLRPCIGCGHAFAAAARVCPRCGRDRKAPNRPARSSYDDPDYRRAAAEVRRRDRTCRWILAGGRTCGSSWRLSVHHLDPVLEQRGRLVHDPARMILVCGRCHPEAEKQARARSKSRRTRG